MLMQKNKLRCQKRAAKWKDKILFGISAVSLFLSQGSIALADSNSSGTSDVLNGLKNAKSLYLGIIAIIGAIQTARHVMDFSDAMHNHDGAAMKSSGLGIAGGLIMVFISTILAFLGV
ncbi:MAG: hypothetical protein LUH14_03970 [Clostridiaceae bacterium]|nr:hypothetical protein [Clostridiaceae bacterium]